MKRTDLFAGFIISLFVFLMLLPKANTKAETKFRYKDYALGKYVTYYGTIPSYEIEGNAVDLSEQPSLLSERGIAYASAKALFKDNLGASVTYSKSKKRLTIKYKGHVLRMYVGETRAELDGMEIETPSAPFRIKYKKSKIIATMVPTRFVAETLKMEYEWNAETSTVSIRVPFYYEKNGEYIRYMGTKGKITFEGENIELYDVPSIIIEDTALINSGSDLFETAGVDFSYDEDEGIINLSYGDNSLVYCVDSRIVYINGLLNRCAVAPSLFYIEDKDEDVLYLPGRFTMENLGFVYVWNSETGTSEVSVYKPEEETEIETEDENEKAADTDSDKETDAENDNESVKENNEGESSSDDGNSDVTDVQQENNNTEENNKEENTTENNTEENNSEGNNSEGNTSEENTDPTGNVSDSGEDDEGEITDPEPVVLAKELVNVYNTTEGYKFFVDRDNCVQTLKLPIPSGITSSDIEMRETLLDCMTDLVIKGNYSEFYREAEVMNTGEAILQIQVYYDPNTDETIIRLLSDIVLGCGLYDNEDGFIDVRMDFVKNIYKKVIVLDAGHGAHDPGAQAEGYDECDLNLKIVLNCRELFKDTDIKVYYTRIDNTFLSLYDRADFAELVGADMFIAVHHNSSYYTDVTGTSVYYGDKDTYTSLNGLTSEKLAWKMLESLTEDLETKVFATGVINKNFVVVRDSKAPAVLLEIGFMSNHDELSRMVTDKFSKKAAKAIYKTVLSIYKEAEE
ncbi:MAG: N-acetylmuramoyl-L-alanine amidase [Lachnospiraceae bacterium]|nr:N-acetylmuramoyl-L-alanine amidase [Lachnospiraceae bacterium]